MPNKDPKSLKSLVLESSTELAQLSLQAQSHQTLRRQICTVLPKAYRSHVIAVSLDNNEITIVCDSAPWATRLRFYAQNMLQNLVVDHNYPTTLKRVTVKVRPQWHPS